MTHPVQIFEQSIQIATSATLVEHCVTDRELMHQWLNPALRCEPVDDVWDTALGGKSRFIIQLPLWQPTLLSTVVERTPGLIVWEFEGFFNGRDRWECQPNNAGTLLLNQFQFAVPNPIVAFGFKAFAAKLTKQDMEAQLRRLKQVAERQSLLRGQ